MPDRSKYLTRRGFALALAWRLGLLVALTPTFPFITSFIAKVSNCASIGGACGAVALVSGLWLKPIIFLVFVASMLRISMRRARDVALPGSLGLIVPLLLLMDWHYGVTLGAHWSVGFSIGRALGTPYYIASALACIAFLCTIRSGESSPGARFGIAGALALTVTGIILVLGLPNFGLLGIILGVFKPGSMQEFAFVLRVHLYTGRIVPWALLLQVALLAYLIFRDTIRKSPGASTRPPQAPLTSPSVRPA